MLDTLIHKNLGLLRYRSTHENITFSTLGPEGTSSEFATKKLIDYLDIESHYELYPSYEQAAESIVQGNADFLVVANAYQNINKFYINNELDFFFCFLQNTLPYGIAISEKTFYPSKPALLIASHPAPAHLIELLPKKYRSKTKIIYSSSTSQAAHQVKIGEVDLCITNQSSAEINELKFISRLQTIEMLWTIFKSKTNNDY